MQLLKKKGGFNAGQISGLIISILGGVILFQMIPSLFPLVATALHNFSDTMVTYYTSTVAIPALATIYGLIDTWFGFAVAGGLLGFIIFMAVNLFSRYARGRNKSKGYYRPMYRR